MRVQFPCLYLPASLSVAALTVLAWRPVSLVKNNARQLNRRFLGRGQTTRSRRPHAGGGSPIRQCPCAMHANAGRTTHEKRGVVVMLMHGREGEGGQGKGREHRQRVVNGDRRRGRLFPTGRRVAASVAVWKDTSTTLDPIQIPAETWMLINCTLN
jgi:hypothetical protein